MSRFQSQQQGVAWLYAQVERIKAQLSRIATPGGQIRVDPTTLAGGIWAHDHSNAANGGFEAYVAAIASNWNGNQNPGDVWQALDQLAARIKAIENVIIGIPAITYPANTLMFNGIE